MRLSIALLTATAALYAAGTADAAGRASVEVRDVVARITVIPENRTDVKVEVTQSNPRLPLRVSTLMDHTTVKGEAHRRIRSCAGAGETAVVRVQGVGNVRWADMPRIVIRTPRDVNLDTGGAIWGAIGRSASLKLGTAGCGDWTVGNADGALTVSQAGSVGVRTGGATSGRLRLAGSGNLSTAEIRGGVEIDIAGSGDVRVASIAGPLKVNLAGSGDVRIGGGRATAMTVAIAGSGNVDFDGAADSLKARIAGSGDVHAREVKGQVSKAVLGSGRVAVGG